MARVNTADVCSDAETEKNEHFHYEDRRRADLVFDCGSPQVDEKAPDPDCDNHTSQADLESEVAAGSSGEDNLLDGGDSWHGDLGQLREREGSHEPHRAWVVTLPPGDTCLEATDNPGTGIFGQRPRSIPLPPAPAYNLLEYGGRINISADGLFFSFFFLSSKLALRGEVS